MKTEIVPGCLCLVLAGASGRNAGKVTRAIRFVGEQVRVPGKALICFPELWEVEDEMEWGSGRYPFAPEQYLLRIDGYEDTDMLSDQFGEHEGIKSKLAAANRKLLRRLGEVVDEIERQKRGW